MVKQKKGAFKKLLRPIMNLDPYVKAIWYDEKLITILVDDALETPQQIKKLETAKDKTKLSFSKNKSLTLWWEMVRHAEPKALLDLKHLEILYDPTDYVKLFKSMIEKETLFPSHRKADYLFERAQASLDHSEQLLLHDVSQEIYDAMTETAQAMLLYLGKFAPQPQDVLQLLEHYAKKSEFFKSYLYESYKLMHEEVVSIRKGDNHEFSSKDAGYYLSQAKHFLFEMEDLLATFEKEKSDRVMHEAYNFCLRLCEMALKLNMKILPLRDDEKIDAFKKQFVDHGLVDEQHFKTLKALYHYNKLGKKGKLQLKQDKCLDRVRIKNLGLAVQDVLR